MSAPVPDETILGLISVKQQHGYQMLDTFNDPAKLGSVWKLSTSQLYAVLKRLERQKWIVGSKRADGNAPPRTEYTLTHAGWMALQAWLFEQHPSASIRRVRVEFLSRLYVAKQLGIDPLPLIARQRASCTTELARLRALPPADSVGGLATAFVIAQLEAILPWLDRCAAVLQST